MVSEAHRLSGRVQPVSYTLMALGTALFSVLWIDLWMQLSKTWSTREQYSYGWFVPLFAIYAFWQRWLDRPVPDFRNPPRLAWIPLGLIIASYLPARVIYEINPDWPVISWATSLSVVAITLFGLQIAGGRPWALHFLFPVCIILVAVAWPDRVESVMTKSFMRVVTFLTVECLGLLGVPAVQRGNLIEVGAGVVGVEDACSGIRSFQSTVMAGLLLGEFYRVRPFARGILLGLGLTVAFVLNVVRTLWLSWQASKNGVHSVEKWHDSAGFGILVVSFVSLWLLTLVFKSKWQQSKSVQVQDAELPRSCGRPFWVYLLSLGGFAVLVLVANEAWYRVAPVPQETLRSWNVIYPTNATSFERIELSERVNKLMGHDEGGAASWMEPDGIEWTCYFFKWYPRSIETVMMSRVHRPDVCLPAAGFRQIGDSTALKVRARGLELPFRSYTYESNGRHVHVFFCHWEVGNERQLGTQSSMHLDRLLSVLSRKRRLAHQSLELIATGYPSQEAAISGFTASIERWIELESIEKPTPAR